MIPIESDNKLEKKPPLKRVLKMNQEILDLIFKKFTKLIALIPTFRTRLHGCKFLKYCFLNAKYDFLAKITGIPVTEKNDRLI